MEDEVKEEKEFEESKKEKKTKRIKIDLGLNKLIFLIILVVVVFVFIGLGLKHSSKFIYREELLKLGFENIGELVTQTCHTRIIEDSKENRTFFDLFDVPFTESRQIFTIDYDVDASLKFSEIKLDINDSAKEVKIILPHAKVKDVISHEETMKILLDSESWFSRISLEENKKAKLAMKDKAKVECLENGLLEKADINAAKLIEGLVNSVDGFKNYKKVFEYIEVDNNEENR